MLDLVSAQKLWMPPVWLKNSVMAYIDISMLDPTDSIEVSHDGTVK